MADGARLRSDVSLRSFLRNPIQTFLLLRLVLILGVVGVALGSSACEQETRFGEPGLPADLPHYLGQLKALKVPAEVSNLAWIPTTLRELDASQTEVAVISFVPLGMERLDLHAAKNLKQLPVLPISIRELDIRFTQIAGPWKFPNDLQFLALGGEHVETLEGLSDLQLLELTLEDVANLQSTAGLPTSLQSLSISNATFTQLIELPPQLKELRLENTQIRRLKGLPRYLHSMTLIGNGVIDAELPHSLLSLTLSARWFNAEGQRLLNPGQINPEGRWFSTFDRVAFLNDLDLKEWVALEAFPQLLRDLRVPTVRQFKIPQGLRRLQIKQSGEPLFSELPAGLEELNWPGAVDLTGLPAGLKHLAIPSSTLANLSALRPEIRLESLDVSLTKIPIDKLPDSLLSLRYRFCGFSLVSGLPKGLRSLDLKGSADVQVLQDLPTRLERLDVSETSIARLPALPDTLIELDISKTPIIDLQALKHLRRLRRLTVHADQLQSLAGLPASVSELRFVK